MAEPTGRHQAPRPDATPELVAEVASTPCRADEPVIAIRSFGAGRLVLAVAGAVDGPVVDRLRALLDEPLVRELGAAELVVDLSEVSTCVPALARFLHRVRTRRTGAGCRVELRNPSEALGVGLEDATLSEAFTVYDAVRRRTRSEIDAGAIPVCGRGVAGVSLVRTVEGRARVDGREA